MKVEKCPTCGFDPTYGYYFATDTKTIFEIFCYGYSARLHKYMNGKTMVGTVLKWKMWAHREARRIAREGATK